MSSPIIELRSKLRNLLCIVLLASLALYVARGYILASVHVSRSSVGFATLLFLSLVVSSRGRQSKSRYSTCPRVKGRLPGNLDILWQLVKGESSEYCANTLRRWEQEYGPTFDMNILWGHQLVTTDPSNIKEILATNFPQFEKSTRFRDMVANFLGDGVFTSDGDDWKRHRAVARPFFAYERTSDFDLFERHSEKLITLLAEHGGNSTSVNVQDLFSRLTMDSIAEFLLGINLDTLSGKWSDTNEDYSKLVTAFEQLQSISMTRIRIGSNWPLFELFKDTSEEPARVLNKFIEPIVQHAFADKLRSSGVQGLGLDDKRSGTYLQYLVDQLDDQKAVRDSVVSMMMAGRDTTASLLSFVTYCLAAHPGVTRKVREEIIQTCGSSSKPPTPAELKSMRYLRAVINETLRLFPPVPMNIRRAAHETTISSLLSQGGPFVVPKNVSITYAPLLMQRRTDIWGADAEEFKPERWIVPDGSTVSNEGLRRLTHVSNPFSFVPFNAGPRICLGQSFALNECSYTIVRMLQAFDRFELDASRQRLPPYMGADAAGRQGVERCWPRASLTLYIDGGLWVTPVACNAAS